MKSKSFLFLSGIFVLIATIVYGGILYWQNYSLEAELADAEKEFAIAQNQYKELLRENVFDVVKAARVIAKIDEEALKWSKILTTIGETVSGDSLDILAYSGAGGRDLTLNVSTRAAVIAPYFAVADFIEAFDKSVNFSNNFVPSIASGINAEGQEILSFSFNTRYEEEEEVSGAASPILRVIN